MRLMSATLFLLLCSCKQVGPPAAKPPVFTDNFDRAEIGASWRDTAAPGTYRITNGELVVHGAHNHPLWLNQPLPRDAVIEVDAWSADPDGDIKVEAFGDGQSAAVELSYTSTGYVFIQGGWKNRITALCRMHEHSDDRKTREDLRVEPRRRYHWMIARHGDRVEWFIDGRLALDMTDPQPLAGAGHDRFAFDNWETELHFDNLQIRPY